MAGYKSYRKSKVKKYQKGGAVSGQTTAGPARMGRRSTDSPFGTSPGSGEQTPRETGFDWSKRVGTTPGYAHWGGVGRAQMLGPTTMGGYAGGPASMDQYYGWGQPNPPDAPMYEKGGKVMEQYKKGGKVSDKQVIKLLTKYLETKKNPKVRTGRKKHKGVGDWFPENEKKTEDFKAMTMRTQSLRKMLPEKKLAKRAKVKTKKKKEFAKGGRVAKEGGIELIRSMRGMSLRELMDLNKKMVRG